MSETTSFPNVYDDAARAAAYATLDYPGTYYLAFRDLPAIIAAHVRGGRALDFGCGTGRSTRFLKALGFAAVGIDISPSMIRQAVSLDPGGSYLLVDDGDFSALDAGAFDLVLSAFAFDNIAGEARRCERLRALGRLLRPAGRMVLLGSRPEIYTHEWASFTTREFPENRQAGSGDVVRIVMKDVADARPVVDFVWQHQDYLELFAAAGLELVEQHTPLGMAGEPIEWLSETSVAPWVIYVLKP
jgi:SAM-dependent methyltransferase